MLYTTETDFSEKKLFLSIMETIMGKLRNELVTT